MSRMVNVKGKAKVSIVLVNEIYKVGDMVDIKIDEETYNSIGKDFFKRTIDCMIGYQEEQKPVEEIVEKEIVDEEKVGEDITPNAPVEVVTQASEKAPKPTPQKRPATKAHKK